MGGAEGGRGTLRGAVKCWGGGDRGQLGNGTEADSSTPVSVSGITGATRVVAGEYHSCAIVAGGEIKCWGENYNGQLGNGTDSNEALVPVTVVGITGAIQISAGLGNTCALVTGGSFKCWGGGLALGNGTNEQSSTPVSVLEVSGATAIGQANIHACAAPFIWGR